MAKLCPLFSGSRGNSYYISAGGTAILVDTGRSAKQLQEMLSLNGLDISSIKAIFITHEHTDHISALRVFASRLGVDVYASGGTMQRLAEASILCEKFRCHEIEADKPVDIGSMQVSCFETPHDSASSVGYCINTSDGTKLSLATDLGHVSDRVRNALRGSDVLVLESNHNVQMLNNGAYPYELKRRILSDKGHLSNEDCASELFEFVNCGTKHILLSHLSADNNTVELARETSVAELKSHRACEGKDYTLDVAPVANTSGKKILF